MYTSVIDWPVIQIKEGEVISKEDLEALLDRSEIIKEFEENKKLRQGNKKEPELSRCETQLTPSIPAGVTSSFL